MFRTLTTAALVGAGILAFTQLPAVAAGPATKMPAPAVTAPASANRETAIFAGGCFWGVQGVYSHVKGVISATSGYTGGSAANAHYNLVSGGGTGHAESVKVVFDPNLVSYADLLRIYFSVVADPTQVNRQGPDVGTQYRSALFPQNAAQAKVAHAYIKQLEAAHMFRRPIATRIEAESPFYPAESYHQDFYAKNPSFPYIVINDRPKVEGLKKLFPNAFRS